MLLPRRRNGCRDDAERIALPFQEMDDVRQGVDGRTVAIGIVHEDDQMAMEIGPQLQLLLNVFHFFIGCLARPVGIAGQGIPADFDIADVVDSRPEVLGEVPFRTARSTGNDGPDAENLINFFFCLQELVRVGLGRNVYFLIIMRIRMDADGIARLVDFLDHIRVADDILAGQEEGSMDVFLFRISRMRDVFLSFGPSSKVR